MKLHPRFNYSTAPALLFMLDARFRFLGASNLWMDHFGYADQELIGKQFFELLTPEAAQEFRQLVERMPDADRIRDIPSKFTAADSRVVDVLVSVYAEHCSDDNAVRTYSCSFADVTLQIQIQRALEQRARLDGMTGIPNRAWLRERAGIEIARAARYARPLSFVMIDADNFKKINDKYGHAAGDRALIILANEAKLLLRGSDEVGRVGGEEFAMVLPETNAAGALHVADRLRLRIESLDLDENGLSCPFTVSMGVVQVSVDETVEQAFKRADAALYQAKEAGRNRVVIGQPGAAKGADVGVTSLVGKPGASSTDLVI